jgi:hypothetical protein
MKTLLLSLLLTSLSATPGAFGADKINNAGGIWICENNDLDITSSVLVDFYEAENEFKWTLIQPTQTDPWKIAEDLSAGLPARFPQQASAWASAFNEVRTRFDYILGELEAPNDSKFRAKPLPSLCRTGGGWHYRQFANWDDRSNHGIIRKDYWESPRISSLDKAGLLWHEAIYRWLRVAYGDNDSVRAREIVGVLFAENNADFSQDKARARVAEILGRKPPVDPTDPAGAWVCAIQHQQSNLWHVGYGADRSAARTKAVESCRESGDFMGFSCLHPWSDVECGQLGGEEKFSCMVPYRRGEEQKFTATGRSLLEARVKALKACGEAVGQEGAWLCSSREAVCK